MDPLVLFAAGAASLTCMGLGLAAYNFFAADRTAASRVAELTGGPDEKSRPRNRQLSVFAQQAAKLAVEGEEEAGALRKRLMQAGFRERNAVEVYSAMRTVGALGLAFLFVGVYFLLSSQGTFTLLLLSGLGGATLGYYAPALYVTNALDHRKSDLLRAFPDSLDLLVSCVEAGLGIDAAFRRVADEMAESAPLLSRELQLVIHEVGAGVARSDALHHLADRTGVEDIKQLVNVLVQAERFGTSIARSLRVHSDLMRTRRMQRAEERAAQVSPKLTIVMILFILPCLIVVLIGPAVINVKNILMPTMADSSTQ